MTTLRTAITRARRGAAFLDEVRGRGWRRRIRRRSLDMGVGGAGQPCGCILQQLYGDYDDGAEALGFSGWSARAEALGFLDRSYDYEPLTEAWLTVLREDA